MQDQAGEPLITQASDQPDAEATRQAAVLGEQAPARRRGLFVLLVVVALVTLVADQLSKLWAIRELTGQDPRQVIGTLLQLELVRNPGAAFSLGTGSTWVLTLIAILVLVVVIRTSRRLGSVGWAWAFGLLLGGALGNLADRLLREPGVGQGHVVDFIDYNGLFIGNVADIAIVSAAILIALLAILGIGVDGSRSGRAAALPSAETAQPAALPPSDHSDVAASATADAGLAPEVDPQPAPDADPAATGGSSTPYPAQAESSPDGQPPTGPDAERA